jgi:hypothetical protein
MVQITLVIHKEEAMAAVKGMKEFVHLPQYDSISIKPKEQLGKILSSNVLRFFVDVTGKTKLQTNMQASSLLPHWNTYEARAMRVVISDLPPQVADNAIRLTVGVVDEHGVPIPKTMGSSEPKTVELEKFTLTNFVDFKRAVDAPLTPPVRLNQVQLEGLDLTPTPDLASGEFAEISRERLRRAAEQFGRSVPLSEQFLTNDFGGVIGKFIYNTVTTFFVGEKIMIQVPTWFFPAGAGPFSEDGKVTTHGYPSPQATFQFAEAVKIDAQQNFRVEIEVPESDVLSDLQRLYGPLFIWVVLDGYMTRDVQ